MNMVSSSRDPMVGDRRQVAAGMGAWAVFRGAALEV